MSGVVKAEMEFEKKLVYVHTEMSPVQVRGDRLCLLWHRVLGLAGVG